MIEFMRIKINKCYSCICNACTKFYCPYPHLRCGSCNNLQFNRIYDCDFFENVRTAPKRYRIKRMRKMPSDTLNVKLDYIIANMGLAEPVIDTDGTYSITYKGMEICRGSKAECTAFAKTMQHEFSELLIIKKLDITM